MKSLMTLVIGLLSLSAFANEVRLNDNDALVKVRIETATVEYIGRSALADITVTTTYPNPCAASLISGYKFINDSIKGNNNITVLGNPGADRVCTTEYNPTTVTIVIERQHGQDLKNLTVNGIKAKRQL